MPAGLFLLYRRWVLERLQCIWTAYCHQPVRSDTDVVPDAIPDSGAADAGAADAVPYAVSDAVSDSGAADAGAADAVPYAVSDAVPHPGPDSGASNACTNASTVSPADSSANRHSNAAGPHGAVHWRSSALSALWRLVLGVGDGVFSHHGGPLIHGGRWCMRDFGR
jgi:hypothetical protein